MRAHILAGPGFPLAVAVMCGCGGPPRDARVQASYDKESGKLIQLSVDAVKDGSPNIFSYMDGSKFVRIEIDKDEDGMIDRWEYYGADQKIEKVGLSRLNDGVADAWMFQSSDGTLGRMDVSTRRDGKPNRSEFFESGVLVRVEQDTNGDGRLDRWETYTNGTLASVSFDTKGTGAPDTTVDYRVPRESDIAGH
jgi:hypothetical protein